VRCGYCRAVFNAYDTLLPEFEAPTGAETREIPPLPPRIAPLPENNPRPSVEFARPELFQPEPDVSPATPLDRSLDVLDDPFRAFGGEIPRLDHYQEIDEYGQEDQAETEPVPEVESEPSLSLLSSMETTDSILLSELPTRDWVKAEGRFWKTAGTGIVNLLLILMLFGQAAYFLRSPLAESLPEVRPILERFCQTMGCKMPLSQQLDLLKMESSSLETDPEQLSRAKLKISFSNRAHQTQAWPCFVLRLSGVHGSAVAQRAFWPKDYLPKTKSERDGMAPMSELEFQLDLDLGGLSAFGYEVKPQYP
jgi:hypothetical protein